MRKLMLTVILLALSTLLHAQEPMNNASVIKMVKAGLSQDLIVSTIQGQPGNYTTTADGLIALKKAGASDKVLAAIVMKASGASATPAAAGTPTANGPAAPMVASGPPPGITEVGVYYKDSTGAWVELLPEVVVFKSAGMAKTVTTVGMVRPDLNGRIQGSRAKLSLSFPVVLAVYMPEGTAITEYQLLRLRINGDAREFRSVHGSAFHSNGGNVRDEVEYQSEKIAPRVYQITLAPSFGRGEYGLLPPGGVNSTKSGNTGKLYTLSVVE